MSAGPLLQPAPVAREGWCLQGSLDARSLGGNPSPPALKFADRAPRILTCSASLISRSTWATSACLAASTCAVRREVRLDMTSAADACRGTSGLCRGSAGGTPTCSRSAWDCRWSALGSGPASRAAASCLHASQIAQPQVSQLPTHQTQASAAWTPSQSTQAGAPGAACSTGRCAGWLLGPSSVIVMQELRAAGAPHHLTACAACPSLQLPGRGAP